MWQRLVGIVILVAIPVAVVDAGQFFLNAPLADAILHGERARKPCGEHVAGYLVVPTLDAHGQMQLKVEPYRPMPGDIILYDGLDKVINTMLKWVGSGSPSHAAMVIARPDGTPALLEVGPNSRPQAFTRTAIVDVAPRMENYLGVMYVRRLLQPLGAEQSKKLTDFAAAQTGKEFAVGRLALQVTPFRPRVGLRHALFAETRIDRERWLCSENVVAAGTVAGIFDPRVHFANAMYPRDLAYDDHYDLSQMYAPMVLWLANPNPQIDGNRVVAPLKTLSAGEK